MYEKTKKGRVCAAMNSSRMGRRIVRIKERKSKRVRKKKIVPVKNTSILTSSTTCIFVDPCYGISQRMKREERLFSPMKSDSMKNIYFDITHNVIGDVSNNRASLFHRV